MGFSNTSSLISPTRIGRRVERLASFTEPDRPYTRRAFTDLYLEARAWLRQEFEVAGLQVHADAGANLVGTRLGTDSGLPAFLLGSHIDTVPSGGRFDGIAGVLAALEVAQALQEGGVLLRHGLQIVDFTSEEPNDYGSSCVGSRAMVGTLSPAMLMSTNRAGEPLADGLRRIGGDPSSLTTPLVKRGDIAAYLELHIEQGPVLESKHRTLGLVQGIAAIRRILVRVHGQAGHAGTVPMHTRRDALVAAARIVDEVSKRASTLGQDGSFVATVGRFDVSPNAINVIPGGVEMIVEARSLDDEAVAEFLEGVRRHAASQEGFSVEVEDLSYSAPARSDPQVLAALERGCIRLGHGHLAMTSGAGHDAMHVAQVAPMAMLFIPCMGGVSHHPSERAEIEDLAAGAQVMLEAVLEMDASL